MKRYLLEDENEEQSTIAVRDRFICIDKDDEDVKPNEEETSNVIYSVIDFNNAEDDEDDSDFYEDDEDDDFETNNTHISNNEVSNDNLLEIEVWKYKPTDISNELINNNDDDEEIINKDDVIEITNNEDIIKNEENLTSNNINDIVNTEEDIKVKVFKALSEYLPMNMHLEKNSGKEFISAKKGIIIEKIGEEIIAVENLGYRPFYVKGEKENLVVREDNIKNYIEWLKNDFIKRYNNGITEKEFDEIEKLIIVENEDDIVELGNNETFITREEALSRLTQKYDVIVDLTMNNCHIKFNDENVNCSIDVEGLGYKIASYTDWAEEISAKLSCFKNRNIIFLGIAGKEKLLKDLNEKFDIEIKRNFESLAWEIL